MSDVSDDSVDFYLKEMFFSLIMNGSIVKNVFYKACYMLKISINEAIEILRIINQLFPIIL